MDLRHIPKEYKPSLFFRSGHINSIYPSLFRSEPNPDFTRICLDTPDEDFLDLDELMGGFGRLAILCHGLEGSSQSHYMRGMAGLLSEHGWDVVGMNYRGCGGRVNKQKRLYHSGATDDLDLVVRRYAADYPEIVLIGFSLGGNLILKYAGEESDKLISNVSSIIAISVPTDLEAGSINLSKAKNYFYEKRFLRFLKAKMRLKYEQAPEHFDLVPLDKINSLYSFDDIYTAPLHGFLDARDYYTKSSSKNFIPFIKRRTMILNALDDPFLPRECYPYKICKANPHIQLITPKYGGHVGFVLPGEEYHWNEWLTLNFIESEIKGQ